MMGQVVRATTFLTPIQELFIALTTGKIWALTPTAGICLRKALSPTGI